MDGKVGPKSLLAESSLTSGLLVAPSRSPLAGGLRPERLEEILQAAKAEVDYVVVDFPAYAHGPLDLLLKRADEVLLVATPNMLALRQLRSWLESKAAFLDTSKLAGILNMYFEALRGWKKALLSIIEEVEVVYFDPALGFTHTRNIAEAMICCEKLTRQKLLELAEKLSS